MRVTRASRSSRQSKSNVVLTAIHFKIWFLHVCVAQPAARGFFDVPSHMAQNKKHKQQNTNMYMYISRRPKKKLHLWLVHIDEISMNQSRILAGNCIGSKYQSNGTNIHRFLWQDKKKTMNILTVHTVVTYWHFHSWRTYIYKYIHRYIYVYIYIYIFGTPHTQTNTNTCTILQKCMCIYVHTPVHIH